MLVPDPFALFPREKGNTISRDKGIAGNMHGPADLLLNESK
jgi:hypothetical protein